MKESTTDLRIIRTKEAIKEALIQLINEKGFEATTVKDITARAKINRGTFYTHYLDKFDLMTKFEEEIMLHMTSIVKRHFPSETTNMEEKELTEIPFSIAVSMFEYLEKHSDLLVALLGPRGDLSFQTRVKEFMWKSLHADSTALFKEEKMLVPKEYLSSYMSSAHIGVIQQWLASGRKESPEEMARILSTITFNGPYFAAGLKK